MSRILAALLVVVPLAAFGQVTTGPAITGTTQAVNDGPGDQTDPHVSGQWVAYTSELNGASEIRYHDLATGNDGALPSNGGLDFLSDISGSTLVYTHVTTTSSIFLYDVAAGGSAVELDPQPGSNRREGRIGGNTVVWQDYAFTGDLATPEIVAYDLVSGTSARLTNDLLMDKDPAVSPDGNVVVWSQCQQDATGCHIVEAVKSGSGWTTQALTSGTEQASFPDTNGQIVVYGSERPQPDGSTDEDIYWQPVGGGPEQRLALPERQNNPNVSGNLIAFEGFDSTAVVPNYDIYVFDLSTQTLYRLTQTPEDETLNDISVQDGKVTVVWTKSGVDFNVYAFTFAVPGTVNCDDQAKMTCDSPGARPLLASLEVDRTTGKPLVQGQRFDAEPGDGLLCIQNGSTGMASTAGMVVVNGAEQVGAWAFQRATTSIEGHLALADHNLLTAITMGKPGSGFHVNVYGVVPGCGTDTGTNNAGGEADPDTVGHPHHWMPLGGQVVPGRSVLAIDGTYVMPPSAPPPTAMGCSSTGTDAAASGLFALLAFLAFAFRRPAPVRVRASESRRRR